MPPSHGLTVPHNNSVRFFLAQRSQEKCDRYLDAGLPPPVEGKIYRRKEDNSFLEIKIKSKACELAAPSRKAVCNFPDYIKENTRQKLATRP